jgi:Transposase DDE domain
MREGTTAEKKIQGRKRHLLVDTQGLLNSVKVLAADIADREGGKELLLPMPRKAASPPIDLGG